MTADEHSDQAASVRHDEHSPVWVSDVLSRIRMVAVWVASKPVWLVAGAFVLASLLRDGIVVWNWFALSPGLLERWSEPTSAFQSNVLFNALGSVWQGVGLDPTGPAWLILQISLALAVFALLAYLIWTHPRIEGSYLALAILLSGGVAAVLWREIGRYDVLFIGGMALALLARRRWMSWVGIAVAAATSPEQLVAAGVLLLLLSLLPVLRSWLPVALRLLAAAAAALILVQVWFSIAGSGGATRIGTLLAHFSGQPIEAASAYDTKQGFVQFTIEKSMISFSAGPGLVWSYLGAATLLLVLFVLRQGKWGQGLYLLIVVALIPVVAGFTFGEDRTRDISLIMVPAIVALTVEGVALVTPLLDRLPGQTRDWLNWLAILVALIPLTYFYLYAEEPFRWFKELMVAINNGVSLPIDGSAR